MSQTAVTANEPRTLPSMPFRSLETRDSSDLSYDDFVRDYMGENRPVVVRRATPDWPALKKWTPEFFKTQFASRKVQVSYEQAMPFSDFIDAVMASTHEKPGPYMYRLFIHEHLRDLLPDLTPQNPYAYPRRFASPLMRKRWRRPDGYLKLLIGGIGGRFPVMHFDGENVHATVTEIYGEKEFVVVPPGDGRYLYPNPKVANHSLLPDPMTLDVERFPLHAKATLYRAVLQPGDMVFIPCGWWHAARALSPSISVGMNIMDVSNWSGFVSRVYDQHRYPPGLRQMTKWAYWKSLGPVLAACERAQERFPAIAHAAKLPELLAPASSRVAPEPSTLRLKIAPRKENY